VLDGGFQKKIKLKKMWSDWNVLYEQQTDLVAFFATKFEEVTKRHLEQKEQERREMEGTS